MGELLNVLPPPPPPYKGGEISAAPYRDRVVHHAIHILGLIIANGWRRLKRANVIRFKRRMRKFQILHMRNDMGWPHIHRSIQSWIGHAKHADTNRLRNLILPEFVFRRESVEGD